MGGSDLRASGRTRDAHPGVEPWWERGNVAGTVPIRGFASRMADNCHPYGLMRPPEGGGVPVLGPPLGGAWAGDGDSSPGLPG